MITTTIPLRDDAPDDSLVFAQNALRFTSALADHHVPYELHVFESGVHGLSLGDETSDDEGQFLNSYAQDWINLALTWLKRQREKRHLQARS